MFAFIKWKTPCVHNAHRATYYRGTTCIYKAFALPHCSLSRANTATTTAISPSQLPSETAVFLRFAPFSPRTQSLENECMKNTNLFSAFID
jgi:hypothetical protein